MDRPLEIEELLRHAGWLRGLAASLVRDPAAADDLVQDAWVAALRHPPGAAAGEARGWLARVAGNLARNARRTRTRRADRETLARDERVEPAPDELLAEAEVQRLLAELVTELDEPLRVVVVLRWFRGLDSAQIGRELGLSPGAVRTRQQRALAELRAKLDRSRGRESWAALLIPLAPSGAQTPALIAASGLLVPAGVGLALVAGLVWYARRSDEAAAVRSALVAGNEPAEAATRAPALRPSASSKGSGVEREAAAAALGPGAGTDALDRAADEVELAGIVLVDGAEPTWPLQLVLSSPSGGTAMRAQPASTTTGGARAPEPAPLELHPDARGAFSFGRVPASWSGRIAVLDHELEDGRRTLSLTAPAADLVLRVRSTPAITGRYLDPSGAPIANAWFAAEVRGETDGMELADVRTVATTDEGRFRVPLDVASGLESAAGTLLLEVDDRAHLRTALAEFRLADGLDLGDLVAEPVSRLVFRVLDEHDAPIADAIAQVGEPLHRMLESGWPRGSAPTEPDGRGELRHAPARATLVRFAALRYASRRMTVEPGASPAVRLARLACLDVRVTGTPERGARLALSAEEAPFALAADSEDMSQQRALGAARPDEWREQGRRLGFALDGERLLLVGLRPDVVLTLDVTEADGRLLGTRTVVLAPGEWQTLVLDL
jgi:RNA polymerase sigma-70 factor (ECF subfamily)